MVRIERALVLQLLLQVIKPVVMFAVRHAVRLQDLVEIAKAAYVEAASKELALKGGKANVSKISVLSGVHRRDVIRIQSEGFELNNERDLITKIIGQWRNDKRYLTKQGTPRILSIGGADSEFAKLVASVSQDLNPGTVFYELCRIEAVTMTRQGVKLLIESFVPKGDPVAGFQILAEDGEDLVMAVEQNVLTDQALPHLHARTTYDNIRPKELPQIKRWFLVEGHKFHAKVREYLSKFDQDINPDSKFKGKGARVVFSSFSVTDKSDGEK